MNISTTFADSIEFFIPRDPQMIVPPMLFQNSTSINAQRKNSAFDFYLYHLTETNPNLTFAAHFEIHPSDANVSYLLTYQFDSPLPPTMSPHPWTLLSPLSKIYAFALVHSTRLISIDMTEDGTYVHFLNNNQTARHRSVVYGLRQLPSTETCHPNSSSFLSQPWSFTCDFEIRMYQSGCFYLDSNHHWQSDGLRVTLDFSITVSLLFLVTYRWDH